MEGLCDRILWLDQGAVRMIGEPRRVIDAYREAVATAEGRLHQEAKDQPPADDGGEQEVLRWGSRQAEIVGLRLLVAGEERYHLRAGEPLAIELVVEAKEPLTDFVFGVALGTPRGVEVWGTNTDLAGYRPARLVGRTSVRVDLPALQLGAGEYVLDVAVHARDGAPYDYRRRALSFSVTSARPGVGFYQPTHTWQFAAGVSWEGEGNTRDEAPAGVEAGGTAPPPGATG
jgi:hypothetical protein